MSKIIIRLKDNRVKEWQEYRDKYLFTCGSDAFQLNIFPLGKKRVNSWPREYSEMFGYEKDDYLSTVRRYRFQHILHNRKQFGNPLTICFGKSCWEDFKECLNLQISTYTPLNPFVLYQHDRVILAPFFWYGGKIGMTDPRIETLVKCINDNKLNPFARDEVRSFL